MSRAKIKLIAGPGFTLLSRRGSQYHILCLSGVWQWILPRKKIPQCSEGFFLFVARTALCKQFSIGDKNETMTNSVTSFATFRLSTFHIVKMIKRQTLLLIIIALVIVVRWTMGTLRWEFTQDGAQSHTTSETGEKRGSEFNRIFVDGSRKMIVLKWKLL